MPNSILKCQELCCFCEREIPEEDKDLDGYCYECFNETHVYCCSCNEDHYIYWQDPECSHIFWNEKYGIWDGAGYEEIPGHFSLEKELFYVFLNEINEKGVYSWDLKYPRKRFFDKLIQSIQQINKGEIYIKPSSGTIEGASFDSIDLFFHRDIDLEEHKYVVKWLHSLNPKSPVANQLVIDLIKEWQRLAPNHWLEDFVFSNPWRLQSPSPAEERIHYLLRGHSYPTQDAKPEWFWKPIDKALSFILKKSKKQ